LGTKLLYSNVDLIEQSKKGDHFAFRQLVERNQQRVRTTVIGMLGEGGETEDVAQEVFIRLYKSLNDFRGEAKLETYLTRIAINLSLNELKSRQKRKARFFLFQKDESAIQIEDLSVNPSQFETKELIQKALQLLEPDFRSVVILRMIEGYSVKETADILELPQGTIASRLARAQKKLYDILSKIM
jgi:RNA polymerase sigma-70 factor (ECF subfamily)